MGGYFQSEAFLKAMDILKTEFPLAICFLLCYTILAIIRLTIFLSHFPLRVPQVRSGRRLLTMGTLKTVLIVIEAICSIALIVVVLLQSGKEAGLSSALTGASETYLSKNKQGNLDAKLASLTKWIALVWVLLTLALSLV